jgi:hypothetical protein
MSIGKELGPLEPLVGTWEGDVGLDVSFSHSRGAVHETPYRERATFSAFGPVENGTQVLFGLDYRAAMWRGTEENPFHTEIGYWLWDADSGTVLRCFMVPRGVTVLAGGPAAPGARSFTVEANAGSETFGVLQNAYLLGAAKTLSYSLHVDLGPDSYRYEETTLLQMNELAAPLAHTDGNTLHRIA